MPSDVQDTSAQIRLMKHTLPGLLVSVALIFKRTGVSKAAVCIAHSIYLTHTHTHTLTHAHSHSELFAHNFAPPITSFLYSHWRPEGYPLSKQLLE